MREKAFEIAMDSILASVGATSGKISQSPRAMMLREGKICIGCSGPLPPPHSPGTKYCILCSPVKLHKVYLSFQYQNGWHCRFFEWNLKTQLPKTVTFQDPTKLFELASRGNGLIAPNSHQAIDEGIRSGKGWLWLRLTDEQYQTLHKV